MNGLLEIRGINKLHTTGNLSRLGSIGYLQNMAIQAEFFDREIFPKSGA
jgi:hypothetical protein